MRTLITAIVLLVGALILVPQVFYKVDETQFVVITRFGQIGAIRETPGLKIKTPFIDTVNRFDKRVLRIDVAPTSMPDRDNQFLDVDAYVRYRILDPRKFIENLQDERRAASSIGPIVIAELRNAVGNSTQEEIIGGVLIGIEEDRTVVEAKLTPEGIPSRAAIVEQVRQASDQAVGVNGNDWGITIVDVRIKRADFPAATQENIFSRMRSERSVQAQRLRAEGAQENLQTIADVDRQVEVIAAEADEASNRLRGEGEGEAIAILAEALERDPDLFTFLRTLEAYRVILGSQTTVVLPADADLFQFLQSPDGN
ncbi:MAG: protease modulator HflC [Dehalococcoidia bacterium]